MKKVLIVELDHGYAVCGQTQDRRTVSIHCMLHGLHVSRLEIDVSHYSVLKPRSDSHPVSNLNLAH